MQKEDKRFLVDVGMKDLPFPMRVASRVDPEGQSTVANISIHARIMQTFEARWIDKFIQILHQHRERIGTSTLQANIRDYVEALQATALQIDFDYPFFVAKQTPVTKENCLVQYLCKYSVKTHSADGPASITFKIGVPCITTYPASTPHTPKGLFGQLSMIDIAVETDAEVYAEDLVALVDRHALASVYSFLSPEDQQFIIEKVHSQEKTSVVVVDEIKKEIARNRDINWYSIDCSNYGMLHSYSTVIRTEKSMWVPFSGFDEQI